MFVLMHNYIQCKFLKTACRTVRIAFSCLFCFCVLIVVCYKLLV